MGYQSRKRNYVSRREKFQKHLRNYRVTLLFVSLALIVLFYKNWDEIWRWMRTYFY